MTGWLMPIGVGQLFLMEHSCQSVTCFGRAKMNNEQSNLQSLFKGGFANEPTLRRSLRAGCYYCTRIFLPAEICDWIDDKPFRTAVCPECGTDSVIPESEAVDLTPMLLKQLQHEYFPSVDLLDSINCESYETVDQLRSALDRVGIAYRTV